MRTLGVFVRGEQVQRMMWLYRLEKSERREEWGEREGGGDGWVKKDGGKHAASTLGGG